MAWHDGWMVADGRLGHHGHITLQYEYQGNSVLGEPVEADV